MATDSWNKYDKHKAIGGINKKARNKAQREIKEMFKVDDAHDFVTVMDGINAIQNSLKNISQRLTTIEQKLGIQQQTQ